MQHQLPVNVVRARRLAGHQQVPFPHGQHRRSGLAACHVGYGSQELDHAEAVGDAVVDTKTNRESSTLEPCHLHANDQEQVVAWISTIGLPAGDDAGDYLLPTCMKTIGLPTTT
jgi:hypothetical protein